MYVTTGANDILLSINDYVNKETASYQLTDISNNTLISEIIEKIKVLKNYTYSSTDLVLYFARVECKLSEKLSTYNKSNRKTIKLELYLSKLITINVRTLQSCGTGTSRCIPFWSFCFRQNIKIKIIDTCEVRVLKQKIYNLTDESTSIPVENIVLLYKGAPLNNFLTLKESELIDNCRIDYFVPLCYIYKKKKEESEEDEDEDENEEKLNEHTKYEDRKVDTQPNENVNNENVKNENVNNENVKNENVNNENIKNENVNNENVNNDNVKNVNNVNNDNVKNVNNVNNGNVKNVNVPAGKAINKRVGSGQAQTNKYPVQNKQTRIVK
ncbi:conserved Plasmodium protein, unknown function [Plasmodium reichenowi]|uniref:Ubiquitin-like domain-containing protein n=1 Tax=Plasmodium reichenowi TaxID=5854 RepID=A0A060RRQ0_PLARE|nr:conserved Plasmodium protein, unknown function [Plasmodium reichenowi]